MAHSGQPRQFDLRAKQAVTLVSSMAFDLIPWRQSRARLVNTQSGTSPPMRWINHRGCKCADLRKHLQSVKHLTQTTLCDPFLVTLTVSRSSAIYLVSHYKPDSWTTSAFGKEGLVCVTPFFIFLWNIWQRPVECQAWWEGLLCFGVLKKDCKKNNIMVRECRQ